MIAKLAYLTSPAPNVFVLNYQVEGCDDITRVEISKRHVANIVVTGAALAYDESSNRVPETPTESASHGRAASGT